MWKVNGRQTTDDKWWQKLTLPLARWAKKIKQYWSTISLISTKQTIQLSRVEGWDYISRFNPTMFQCLSQVRTDFQLHMSWSFFYVQWVSMRGDCWFCWYWWNCWPSLFKLSFHNHFLPQITEHKRKTWHMTSEIQVLALDRQKNQLTIKWHFTILYQCSSVFCHVSYLK